MVWCGSAVSRVSTLATAAERLETNLFRSNALGLAMENSSPSAGSGSGATCSLDSASAMLASLVWAIASDPPVAGFQEIRCRLEAREIQAPPKPCEARLRRRAQCGGFSASRRLHAVEVVATLTQRRLRLHARGHDWPLFKSFGAGPFARRRSRR